MKKNRQLLKIVLMLFVVSMLLNGCSGKASDKDTIKNNDTTGVTEDRIENVSTEENTEDILGNISASEDVSHITEEDTETVNISPEKSPKEMTTAEKIQYLTIEGQPISLPCQVKDLSEGFSLGQGFSMEHEYVGLMTSCNLEYNGEIIGSIMLQDCDVGFNLVDMSEGFEEKWIYFIELENCNFEWLGLNNSSTVEDVIEVFGEPNLSGETYLEYIDPEINVQQDIDYDHITLYISSSGKIKRWDICTKKHRIEEG